MEYLFVYGAKCGEIKEKETTKWWQEIGKDGGARDMSWERQTREDREKDGGARDTSWERQTRGDGEKDGGARDRRWERQTRGDGETRLHLKEREPQSACADRASILPSSRYLLRTYKAKLCIYLVNQVEQVTEFRG